nr:hypothetical protein [uncultured Agathobacter sp.]
MNKSNICYMEKDGAVKIPDKYKKMSHDEISAECVRLTKTVKNRAKQTVKKVKIKPKTKFVI